MGTQRKADSDGKAGLDGNDGSEGNEGSDGRNWKDGTSSRGNEGSVNAGTLSEGSFMRSRQCRGSGSGNMAFKALTASSFNVPDARRRQCGVRTFLWTKRWCARPTSLDHAQVQIVRDFFGVHTWHFYARKPRCSVACRLASTCCSRFSPHQERGAANPQPCRPGRARS